MSILSKLFGADKGGDSGSSPRAGLAALRTSRGMGYDKMQCLGVLDMLNSELQALTEAKASKDKGGFYTLPPETAVPEISQTRGGFETEDVDAYIGEILGRIRELRSQL